MDQLQHMDLQEELDEVIELVNKTIKLVKKLDKV